MDDDLKLVTYCGLYCRLCAQCGRIPRQAQRLRESMDREGYPFWGKAIPDFEVFWQFLTDLADENRQCQGCRSGACGDPDCAIRRCAVERGITICPLCEDYPCEPIHTLAARYPTLIADGLQLKDLGLHAWIVYQEARAATGFAYCDIRYD